MTKTKCRCSAIAVVAAIGACSIMIPRAMAAGGTEIVFPRDPAVIDLRSEFGAKGDGKADDTEALQKAIDSSCGIEGKPSRVLLIPNGVYRVTRTLVVKSALGPWIYGESRDGAVIRLDDGAKDCNSVLRTHPNEKGPTSADWFMRNIRNLTIDAGDNPGTDGIRWYATNSGILRNVRVIGKGKIGINAGFLDQSGPNLIQDADIDGFETGILSQWIWGETISRVTIRNCRKEGLVVSANAVGVEDLTVENTPVAIRCLVPNDWGHWGGVIALVGGRFTTTAGADGPAIVNESVLYARDVKTHGYAKAIASRSPAGDAAGPDVEEYVSHPVKRLFDDSAGKSLGLEIRREPRVPWETDPKKWICANDHGAVAGDRKDDTSSIQKAIDAAAAAGATTVYLRGIGGPDPNWYNVDGEVRAHGSVRHILGLGFGRVLGGKGGKLIVDDRSAPIVKFQSIDSFGGPPVVLENRSAARTMVVESCGVRIVGAGGGDIFATDTPSNIHLQRKGQKLWARQLNPEGTTDEGLVRNEGGDLWVLGVKHEGAGVRFRTSGGGRTEVVGVFNYGPGIKEGDSRPMFDVDGGSFSVAGLREITFGKHCWFVKVRERRGDETRTLGSDREGGWIGWGLYSGWKPALVSAGSVGSAPALVAAVRDGAEGATIEVAAGTFELDGPLEPKAGMTIKGAGMHQTIITQAAGWKPSTRTLPDPEMKTEGMDTRAYLVRLKDKAAGVTISDLTLRGPQVHGAIYGWDNEGLHVHHVRVQDVLWAGIRTFLMRKARIHDCEFVDAGGRWDRGEPGVKGGITGGGIFAIWMADCEIADNRFARTHTGSADEFYGIKARQGKRCRIHHNTIDVGFSIEMPFENDEDVEIDHNVCRYAISIPKYAGGPVPKSGRTFHIHHNWFRDSYSIEFVRNGVEIDHNLFDFDPKEDGGNLISAFGDVAAKGPASFHDNIVSNPGRGVIWINEVYDNLEVRGNHIIARTTATPRKDGLFGFNPRCDFKTIAIRDNVIECIGQARPLVRNPESRGAVIENNRLINVSDAADYANPKRERRPGPTAPLKFECGVHGEFTVDGWQAAKTK